MLRPAWMNKEVKKRAIRALVVAAVLLLVSNTLMWIMPRVEETLNDTDRRPPAILDFVISISELYNQYWPIVVTPVCLCLAAYVFAPTFRDKPNPSQP